MKRIIYILAAAMLAFAGCEYHPYYDGQKFCVYFSRNGLIETDGEHIYVPVISRDPYMIECYGGLGENYSLDIADTQILKCSFTEKAIGTFRYDEPQPAAFVIEPKQIGETEVVITDKDTGESIQLYVHICEAYQSIEVTEDSKIFNYSTRLAFKYGGVDNVLKILMHKEMSYSEYDVVAEGTYEFVVIDDLLYLEMTLPLDENGAFSPSGTPTFRRFQIQFSYGGAYDYRSMQAAMNLNDYPLQTKAIKEEFNRMWYVDVTGIDDLNDIGAVSVDDYEFFAGDSPHLFLWE